MNNPAQSNTLLLKRFALSGCSIAIFQHDGSGGRTYSAALQKRYRAANGEWQSSPTLTLFLRDLVVLEHLITRATAFLEEVEADRPVDDTAF